MSHATKLVAAMRSSPQADPGARDQWGRPLSRSRFPGVRLRVQRSQIGQLMPKGILKGN